MEEKEINETTPGQETENTAGVQPEGNPYANGYYNPYMYPPQGFQPMYGYVPYPPQMTPYPPYGYPPYPPQYGYQPYPPQFHHQPHQPHHDECHGQGQEDPMNGLFGMFGQMIENNPQLSEVSRMVNATGSDFMKGLVVGAGVAMLLSSESIRSALTDILGKATGMFTEETEEEI